MKAVILKGIDESDTFLITVGKVCFGFVFKRKDGFAVELHIGIRNYSFIEKDLATVIEICKQRTEEMYKEVT